MDENKEQFEQIKSMMKEIKYIMELTNKNMNIAIGLVSIKSKKYMSDEINYKLRTCPFINGECIGTECMFSKRKLVKNNIEIIEDFMGCRFSKF